MNSLAPPQQIAYASLEEARAAIDAHAHLEGYVVVTKHTRRVGNKKNGNKRAVLHVWSQSNPQSYSQVLDFASVRYPTAALVVLMDIIRQGEASYWQVQVANGQHNHNCFAHQSAHPQGSTLT